MQIVFCLWKEANLDKKNYKMRQFRGSFPDIFIYKHHYFNFKLNKSHFTSIK